MKRIYLLSLLSLVIGGLLFINASQGVAKIQQKDRTGAPGSDPNCTACHNSGISFGTVPTIIVSDNGNTVTSYEPLKKYLVTVDIQSSGNIGHGFQITGLLDNNTFGGLVESVNEGQKSILNDRWFFENSKNETGGSYSMNWIAPAAGSGAVTFYGSALSTNGDGKTNGDDYENIPNLVLKEGTANGINNLAQLNGLKVYPNPTTSFITIQGNEVLELVSVFDMKGKEVLRKNSNETELIIDVSTLPNGIYTVKVIRNTYIQETKLIKQ